MDGPTGLSSLIRSCVVSIGGHAGPGGSGFFIAPGIVLTCAHVVRRSPRAAPGGRPGSRPADLTVRWNGQTFPAHIVIAEPREHDGDGLWPFPDLAIVELDGTLPRHPCAWLDDTVPRLGAPLYVAGFNKVYNISPELGGATCSYVSPQRVGEYELLRIKDDELSAGMSGGPLLDLEHGGVCGVVKTSRGEGWPLGGLAVPARAIRAFFGYAWKANEQHRTTNGAWRRLRMSARHSAAGEGLLTPAEMEQLCDAWDARRPGLSAPAGLQDLYVEVMGDPVRPLSTELRDLADLIREAGDRPRDSGGRHPMVRLCEILSEQLPAADAEQVWAIAVRLAAVLEAEVPSRTAGTRLSRGREAALIEISLTPDGANRRRYLLTICTYRDPEGRPVVTACEDTPLPLAGIRTRVREALPAIVAELGREDRDVVVEFVLPRALLHEAVEDWNLGTAWAPLGSRFPVLVRTRNRPAESVPDWRRRWAMLLNTNADDDFAIGWLGCQDGGDASRLYRVFQRDEKLVLLGLTQRPSTPAGRDALEAAVQAGIPAAVWSRRLCPEHGPGGLRAPRTQDEPGLMGPLPRGHDGEDIGCGPACAGDRFQTALADRLAGFPLTELPHLVKRLRVEAAGDEQHCGHGLALLWDDPTRPSHADQAQLTAPV